MLDITEIDLEIADIPSEHMQMVADRCGISDAILLMRNVPGLELYVPLSGKKSLDVNYIKSNFNGHNVSSLAVKLGLSSKRVKKIVKDIEHKEFEDFIKNKSMLLVAQKCGESTAIRLMQEFPLHTLYVPKNGFITSIKKYIIRHFNGHNHQTLALKCNVTERFVRSVIADMYASKAQLSLDLFG